MQETVFVYDDSAHPYRLSGSGHDSAIAPFLSPGEKYLYNYGLTKQPDSELPSLEEKLRQLRESDEYLSVRTSTEACFDMEGRPYSGAVAIIVTPKPKKV